jgi:transposase
MLYAGLDLSRKRLDFHLLGEAGETVQAGAAPPDADGLRGLAGRVARFAEPVRAAIESMNGARFVHDRLEQAGWEVEIADALKVKGLAPLACKTDRIDAWVLAELARRDLVPAIWLPDPEVRAERERARFRLHLVRHRSSLKQRVHAVLLAHGKPCPVSDLFGVCGRALLERLALPEPWAATVEASLRLIDELNREIADCEAELRRLGAEHRYVPLLRTIPGIGWVLAYTIAAEIGDIRRFASPTKLTGYTGLCPRVYQSGESDRRGPLAKNDPATCAGRSSKPPPTHATRAGRMIRLVLLASDLVPIAVKSLVESIEDVAPLEIRHALAAAANPISCADPPDAVRVPLVQCLAVPVLVDESQLREVDRVAVESVIGTERMRLEGHGNAPVCELRKQGRGNVDRHRSGNPSEEVELVDVVERPRHLDAIEEEPDVGVASDDLRVAVLNPKSEPVEVRCSEIHPVRNIDLMLVAEDRKPWADRGGDWVDVGEIAVA